MSQSLIKNPTAFEAELQASFAAGAPPSPAQAAAFDRFAKFGVPTRRREGWKWSDFHRVLQGGVKPNTIGVQKEIVPSEFAALNPIECMIVNGRIQLVGDELPIGVSLGVVDAEAAHADLEDHAFVALNGAMARRAVGVGVKAGVTVERPILIRHIKDTSGNVFSQSVISLAEGASAKLIEVFEDTTGESSEGKNSGFYSSLTQIVAEENVVFDRVLIQDTGASCIVHSMCKAKIADTVVYKQTSLSTGSRLSRHETILEYLGRDISCQINSAALIAGKNHSDFTTEIVHHGEACETRQLHRGVSTDQASNIFQGKFKVLQSAQKTDAKMSANALLLSDGADANHKPELEIYADDVECAHGSTAGALDDEALFYMRQRGLSDQQARALLVEAFVAETMELVSEGAIKDALTKRVRHWLGGAA